jgi:hypothetical protein
MGKNDGYGFIKIYRNIATNSIWDDRPYSKGQAWIDILLRVNHQPKKVLVDEKWIEIMPGQTVWSIKDMAEKWGWSRGKVSRFVNGLQSEQMLHQKRTSKFTQITVVNWKKYQQNGHQTDIKRTSNGHQTDTNKNEKNVKNEKNIYKSNDLVEIKKIYDLFIQAFEKNPNTYKLTDKRKTKIRQRLKDAGYEMLAKAIKNTANSEFHRGDNDRGWKADLDFITRSYEQVERLSELDKENKVVTERAAWFYD